MTRPSADPQGHAGRNAGAPEPLPGILPEPSPEVPDPPDDLGPVGVEVWRDVWTAGGPAYRFATDHWIIHRYAQFQERRVELLGIIEAEGWTAVGSSGSIIQHPAARVLADTESKLLALEDRLGLSPEARFRLGINAAEARSKLEEFLAS